MGKYFQIRIVFKGGRQLDAQQRLERFVERERKLRRREAEAAQNINQKEMSHNFSKVAFQALGRIINSTSGKLAFLSTH